MNSPHIIDIINYKYPDNEDVQNLRKYCIDLLNQKERLHLLVARINATSRELVDITKEY